MVRRRHLGGRVPAPSSGSTRCARCAGSLRQPARRDDGRDREKAGNPSPLPNSRSNVACRSRRRSQPTPISRSTRSIRSCRPHLPTGERVQFVVPPAVTRGTVSITIRKPAQLIRRLDDFEREGLFERTATVARSEACELLPFEQELVSLRDMRDAMRSFCAWQCRSTRPSSSVARPGSGKTTFMKGLGRRGHAPREA